MTKIKHTNQMTDREIEQEIEQLSKFEAHVSDLAYKRLANLKNEQKYRKTLSTTEVR